MRIELEDLPQLREVFQTLVSGYHLSYEDFGLYNELQEKEAQYEALFMALGYTLKADQRGFYYLVPESQVVMNTTTQKMALLVFVLTEMLADQGLDPFTAVMRGSHKTADISRELFTKDAELLTECGLDSVEAVERCFLTSFQRLGFASVNGDVLRFRPPVGRFLDACMELGRGDQGEDEADMEEVDGE
jgi:hypothetical protein